MSMDMFSAVYFVVVTIFLHFFVDSNFVEVFCENYTF